MKRKDFRRLELKAIEDNAVIAANEGRPRSANPCPPMSANNFHWDRCYQSEKYRLQQEREEAEKSEEKKFEQAELEALIKKIVRAEVRAIQLEMINALEPQRY